MGLWDKIKSVKNMVTGGGATVSITVETASIEEITVNIKADVKDADIKIEKVYLRLFAREEVAVEDVDFEREENGQLVKYKEIVRDSVRTFFEEFEISPSETLTANTTYNWEYTINLPEDVAPTYKGHNAKHTWFLHAGLDARGNDPDSGDIAIDLY